MKDEIDAGHCVQQAFGPANVADMKLKFAVVVGQPHIVLLLLVSAENADLIDVALEKAAKDSITKCTGAAGDQKGLVCKHDSSLHSIGFPGIFQRSA